MSTIIIIQDGVKRSLDANKPFQIFASNEHAENLLDHLGRAVEEAGGWWVTADIHPIIKLDPKLDAAVPLKWTDPGNVNISTAKQSGSISMPDDPAGPFEAGFAGGAFQPLEETASTD